MPDPNATIPADDSVRIDRGQRVRREAEFEPSHDGKARAAFARPMRRGLLASDLDNHGPAPVTVESVVEVDEGGSAWEALEDD
ncbi:MAG: hypothetical protein JO127_09555 [Caulobacteraceae bacterium]|nr:hypothetical protein [Caulobacteraceae bacterium]